VALVNVHLTNSRDPGRLPSQDVGDFLVSQISLGHEAGGEGAAKVVEVLGPHLAGLFVDMHDSCGISHAIELAGKAARGPRPAVTINEDGLNSSLSEARAQLPKYRV